MAETAEAELPAAGVAGDRRRDGGAQCADDEAAQAIRRPWSCAATLTSRSASCSMGVHRSAAGGTRAAVSGARRHKTTSVLLHELGHKLRRRARSRRGHADARCVPRACGEVRSVQWRGDRGGLRPVVAPRATRRDCPRARRATIRQGRDAARDQRQLFLPAKIIVADHACRSLATDAAGRAAPRTARRAAPGQEPVVAREQRAGMAREQLAALHGPAEREAVEQVARDEADREAVTRPVAVDHRPVVRDQAEPADP